MFNRDLMQDLCAHMSWADAAMWQSVMGTPSSTSDTALRDRLHHIHLVQRLFLSRWQAVPFDPGAASAYSLAALRGWAHACHASLAEFLARVDDAALERTVTLPWSQQVAERFGTEPKTPTLGETMLQVVSHSTHHRGQVAVQVRGLGGEPALTDYIAWVWTGRPAPVWPEAIQ
jgi:uncharacterized damage-inducible protein DinB